MCFIPLYIFSHVELLQLLILKWLRPDQVSYLPENKANI